MIKKNKSIKNTRDFSQIYIVLNITGALFMIGVLGILFINAHLLSRYIQEQLPIELFLKENVSDEQAKSLVESIKTLNYVKTVHYIDRYQAVEIAKKELNITDQDLFETHIFPSSIELTISYDYFQPEKISTIIKALSNNIIIDEIKYSKDLLDKVSYNIKYWNLGISFLSILFLTILIVLIINAIRLNIYSKRFTIKTMQLIGAKKKLIYKYFLIKSLWLGFLGGLLAVTFLVLISYYLYSYLEFPYQQDAYLSIMLLIFLISTGIFISLLSTYFSVRKFLKN